MFQKKQSADFLDVIMESTEPAEHVPAQTNNSQPDASKGWFSRFFGGMITVDSRAVPTPPPQRERSDSGSVHSTGLPVDIQMRRRDHAERLAEHMRQTTLSERSHTPTSRSSVGTDVCAARVDADDALPRSNSSVHMAAIGTRSRTASAASTTPRFMHALPPVLCPSPPLSAASTSSLSSPASLTSPPSLLMLPSVSEPPLSARSTVSPLAQPPLAYAPLVAPHTVPEPAALPADDHAVPTAAGALGGSPTCDTDDGWEGPASPFRLRSRARSPLGLGGLPLGADVVAGEGEGEYDEFGGAYSIGLGTDACPRTQAQEEQTEAFLAAFVHPPASHAHTANASVAPAPVPQPLSLPRVGERTGGLYGSAPNTPAHAHAYAPGAVPPGSLSDAGEGCANALEEACTCTGAAHSLAGRRAARLARLLAADAVDLAALRKFAWSGLPPSLRAAAWQLLLSYAPLPRARRAATVRRKRAEYHSFLAKDYAAYADARPLPVPADSRAASAAPLPPAYPAPPALLLPARQPEDAALLHQVRLDAPRTAPEHPLLHLPALQALLERALYVWGCRHPAAGYVQGMNDLLTPLIVANLEAALSAAFPARALAHGTTHTPGACTCAHCVAASATPYPSLPAHNASPELLALLLSPSFSWLRYLNDLAAAVLGRTVDQPLLTNTPPRPIACPAAAADRAHTSSDQPLPTNTSLATPPAGSAPLLPVIDATSLPVTTPTAEEAACALSSLLHAHLLSAVEADAYWCFTATLDKIQDNFVPSQPGIAGMVARLQDLVCRLDRALFAHIAVEQQIPFVQFAFRWFNCLLMRELRMDLVLRLLDSALCADTTEEFTDVYVYFSATAMLQWRAEILQREFQDIVLFLQHLPTQRWGVRDVELVLSQAFVYQSLFRDSRHLDRADVGQTEMHL